MPELLKVRPDVTRITKLSASKIYQLIEAGDLPAVRLSPRTLRVPADALERFIRSRAVKPGGGR